MKMNRAAIESQRAAEADSRRRAEEILRKSEAARSYYNAVIKSVDGKPYN